MPNEGTAVMTADYALTRAAPELAVMKKVAVDGTLAAIQKRLEALGFDGRAFRRPGTGAVEYEIVVQFRGQPDDLARATRVLTAGGAPGDYSCRWRTICQPRKWVRQVQRSPAAQ